jgi:hypothetical protein
MGIKNHYKYAKMGKYTNNAEILYKDRHQIIPERHRDSNYFRYEEQ